MKDKYIRLKEKIENKILPYKYEQSKILHRMVEDLNECMMNETHKQNELMLLQDNLVVTFGVDEKDNFELYISSTIDDKTECCKFGLSQFVKISVESPYQRMILKFYYITIMEFLYELDEFRHHTYIPFEYIIEDASHHHNRKEKYKKLLKK